MNSDISILEALSAALGVSVLELLSGERAINTNRGFNMLRMQFYVCPICGNVITASGEAVVSCHGIRLIPLEAEPAEEGHRLMIEKVEDEYFVKIPHEMTKTHYISFLAAVRDNGCELIKFYPEGNTEARIKISGLRYLYYYCNRHGLFEVKLATYGKS